jgi:hypothetical protein
MMPVAEVDQGNEIASTTAKSSAIRIWRSTLSPRIQDACCANDVIPAKLPLFRPRRSHRWHLQSNLERRREPSHPRATLR